MTHNSEPASWPHDLTHRQRQVLIGVARGLPTKAIAAELGISVRTAEGHRGTLMRRLKLHSVADLTKLAVRQDGDGYLRPRATIPPGASKPSGPETLPSPTKI